MKVAEMSVEELRNLIKEAIREEKEELLDVKRRIFELETLQSLKEVREGKVNSYDSVEDMLRDIENDKI
ncbi:MAG: hypothetical protein HZA08_06120 [Nitrospirae bacterium]|nr:hypothetical protein [Nitrospirota bacterium]